MLLSMTEPANDCPSSGFGLAEHLLLATFRARRFGTDEGAFFTELAGMCGPLAFEIVATVDILIASLERQCECRHRYRPSGDRRLTSDESMILTLVAQQQAASALLSFDKGIMPATQDIAPHVVMAADCVARALADAGMYLQQPDCRSRDLCPMAVIAA
jgi:hypothetical protein